VLDILRGNIKRERDMRLRFSSNRSWTEHLYVHNVNKSPMDFHYTEVLIKVKLIG